MQGSLSRLPDLENSDEQWGASQVWEVLTWSTAAVLRCKCSFLSFPRSSSGRNLTKSNRFFGPPTPRVGQRQQAHDSYPGLPAATLDFVWEVSKFPKCVLDFVSAGRQIVVVSPESTSSGLRCL